MDSLQTHSYGTRKSNNIPIRPSHRLRPHDNNDDNDHPPIAQHLLLLPQFPPPHVVLHPDDANSKVFLSIGRAFLSVDNRAMTIKDLAEMVLSFGLVAQNVSAASQAITTYIRMHLQRCEAQQDIPLLLRHVLSGTDADDDLLPALSSRTGGAQCSVHPEGRITNFRRGTMVWYLSRATGAPCPFARAGIRLSDYGENGKVGHVGTSAREPKKQRPPHRPVHDLSCGQKRKRSLRSCAAPTLQASSSDSDSEFDHDKPLPKVKLTLRLKPLAKSTSFPCPPSSSAQPSRNIIDLTEDLDDSDSDSDSSDSSMSVDDNQPQQQESRFCLPVYPRRSISIPPYTPSESLSRCPPSSSATQLYRRSPSLAYSISSPPPESDVEEDDAPSPMTRPRRRIDDFSEGEDEQDEIATHDWAEGGLDLDSEGDGETLWESPGPRSPSAPLVAPPLAELKVKEEPRDVQGMLDAWDHFDSSVADARVVEVIAQAAAVLNPEAMTTSSPNVKIESQDPWDWDAPFRQQQQQQQEHQWGLSLGEETIRIKQEDLDFGIESLFPSVGSDSLELEEEKEVKDAPTTLATQRRATTVPIPQSHVLTSSSTTPCPPQTVQPAISTDSITTNTSSPLNIPPPISPGAAALVQLIQALSVHSPTSPTAGPTPSVTDGLPQSSILTSPPTILPSSLLLSSGMTTTNSQSRQTCVSPQAMKAGPTTNPGKGEAEGVVVHTCHPCSPSISATQIEEISVYQMMLGPFLLLRRIDTDFVNLTPIVEWCGKGRGYPVLSMVPNAVVVGRGWGSEKVCGVWVPLEVAQSYVKDLDTCSTGPGSRDDVMEGLNVFLSDELVERFPSALKDFHRTNASGRMLKQFGRWFESMVTFAQNQATASTVASGNGTVPASVASGPLNPQRMIQADTRQSWMQKEMIVPMPMTGAFALGAVLTIGERERFAQNHQHHTSQHQQQVQLMKKEGGEQDSVDVVSPLSAREQEIFRELCVIPGEEEEREEEEEEEGKRVEVEKKEEGEEDISKVVVDVKGDPASVSVWVVAAAVEDPQSRSPREEVVKVAVGVKEAPESKVITRSARATASKVAEKLLQEKQQAPRRSKRVADALAAQTQQQQQRTRSRKRPGSRNTLS